MGTIDLKKAKHISDIMLGKTKKESLESKRKKILFRLELKKMNKRIDALYDRIKNIVL